VTCHVRYFAKDVCRHPSIKSFTLTPPERGHAGSREWVCVLPKGGKLDDQSFQGLTARAQLGREPAQTVLGCV
jgi:hypothetical protein